MNSPEEQQGNNSIKWTRQKKVIVALLAPTAFSAALCYSMIAPFFPEEALKKNASEWQAGLILSVYELVSLVCSPYFGKNLITIGSKFLIVTGVFGLGVTFILFGTLNYCPAGTPFIALAFLLRMCQGISASAMNTSVYTIAAQEFPGAVTTVVGMVEMGMALAFTIGPPIGGLLFEAGGYILPFAVVGGFNLITAIAVLAFMPKQKDVEKKESSSFFRLLTFPEVWLSIATILIMTIALTFLDLTLAQHLSQFNLSTGYKSLFFMILSFCYGVSCPFWGRLADRKSFSRHAMMFGAIINGCSLFLLGPSPLIMQHAILWMTGICLGLVGFGMGAQLLPPFADILTTVTHSGEYQNDLQTQALISGLCNALYPLGSFLGPTIGGVLYDSIGFGWSLTIFAGLQGLLAAAFVASYITKRLVRISAEDKMPYMLITDTDRKYEILNGSAHDPEALVC